MQQIRSFAKTRLAPAFLVLFAAAANAASASSTTADQVWPAESAASVSIGAGGDDQAQRAPATVSFVDPMAAVDGTDAGQRRLAASGAESSLSFVDGNAAVDQQTDQYPTVVVTGAARAAGMP
jgi:hypothetical protein